MDEGAAQAELLLHAAGELASRAVGKGREAGGLQQVGHAGLALGRGVAEQAAKEVDVLGHRQRGIQVLAQALRHVGNARAHVTTVRGAGHVAVEHLHLARLDAPGPGQQGQQGGLAHAVRPDETDHAPCRDVHADIVERGDPLVAVGEALDLGHGPGRGGVHGAEAALGADAGSAGRFTAS